MIFAYFIEDHYGKIMVCKSSQQDLWELPHIVLTDNQIEEGNEAEVLDILQQKCDVLDISIEVIDVISESENLVVFNTYLNSYAASKTGEYRWIEMKDLKSNEFTEIFQETLDEILQIYFDNFNVGEIIKNKVLNISETMQIKTEPQIASNSFNAFVRSGYGGYCPYIFSLHYQVEDGNVTLFQTRPIVRMFVEGDKSDLYVLFANIMALILKIFFNESINVDYLSLFDLVEFNSATVVFQPIRNLKITEIENKVDELFMGFIMSLFIFDQIIGSFSTKRSDESIETVYKEYFEKTENWNWFSRKEHSFFYNADEQYFLLTFKNKEFDLKKLFEHQLWEFIEGVDGKILYQHNDDFDSFHYISYENWNRVEKIINDFSISDYTLVCQNNYLYILQHDKVWFFSGDYREYWVDKEKEKIRDRQMLENKILKLNRKFKWFFPISPGRFEELIADLLETDTEVDHVRLVGRANNPDGGRDILIYKRRLVGENDYSIDLSIGQCKAYKRSVNKSNVTDIRDMLEFYSARGFLLATSSTITTPLIDYLVKLSDSFSVDWWTEREIFNKMRTNSHIADRYTDLYEVID